MGQIYLNRRTVKIYKRQTWSNQQNIFTALRFILILFKIWHRVRYKIFGTELFINGTESFINGTESFTNGTEKNENMKIYNFAILSNLIFLISISIFKSSFSLFMTFKT